MSPLKNESDWSPVEGRNPSMRFTGVIHHGIALFRSGRRNFKSWWRSKPEFDFIYWRVLRKRILTEFMDLCSHSPGASFGEVEAAQSELYPTGIREPLVRVGSNEDGGYLLPESALSISALFSPGVGFEAGFEEFFSRQGAKCFLIDPSVEAPPIMNENIRFEKLALAGETGPGSISLKDWLSECVGNEDDGLGLQMDIEGAEYSALEPVDSSTLSRFIFVIIEFHSLHHLVVPEFRNRFSKIISALKENHVIVHSHSNNALPSIRLDKLEIWPLVEVVAVRRDFVTTSDQIPRLPHRLDRKNLSWRRDWPLRRQ